MSLQEVNEGVVKNRKRKRLGRGLGSGLGKTAGRGSKGQKSRSGYSRHPTFQGGQLPMVRRIPKRGFHNKFAVDVFAINVGDLNEAFPAGANIDTAAIRTAGLVKIPCDEIKILGDGQVTKALKLTVTRISQSAKSKIEAAGGSVTVVQAKRTPDQRVADLRGQPQA
jgi:large subunit ribosomal protein L15